MSSTDACVLRQDLRALRITPKAYGGVLARQFQQELRSLRRDKPRTLRRLARWMQSVGEPKVKTQKWLEQQIARLRDVEQKWQAEDRRKLERYSIRYLAKERRRAAI